MSTLKVNNIQTASGGSNSTPEQIEQGRAKLWASIDGTGTPSFNDSFNCTSVVDENQGDYTLNFSITMANTNYCVTYGSENWEGSNTDSYTTLSDRKDVRTTSSVRFRCMRMRFDTGNVPAFVDSAHMGVVVFGDV
tara:strand:+ start:345 stop:752 length:408 start_codon:yes stop_codon:yes gene_type:complete